MGKLIYHHLAILLEILLQHVGCASYHREVEVEYLEFPPLLRGVVGNPQPLEERLEVVALVDVVVGAQHAQKDALAEAARADEEQKMVSVLHHGEVHRLIDVIEVFFPQLLEVGDAVGQSLDGCHGLFDWVDAAKISNYFVTAKSV